MRSSLIFPFILAFVGCNDQIERLSGAASGNEKSARDTDGDGYSEVTGDCDETDANINPGEAELCDEVDNDCDGDVDDDDSNHVDNQWVWIDEDGDGFNTDYGKVMACDVTSLEEFVEANGGDLDSANYEQLDADDYRDEDGDGDEDDIAWDCDDSNADVYPEAEEICDGQANDCDSADTWTSADEASMRSTFYADSDNDGYGDASSSYESCSLEPGYSADDTDCDDSDAGVNPAATEVCDEVDNNCGGDVDEGVLNEYYYDGDGDGDGDASVTVEECEVPAGYVDTADDCNDSDASIYYGASETCADDGVDNDCDGDASETPTDVATVYYDFDGDGYGDASDSWTSCTAPSGYVSDSTDCDDTDASVNPGVSSDDGSDGIDNDCDEEIDEDPCVTTLNMLSNNGEPDSFTISSVTDDSSLEGDLYLASTGASAVSGVTTTATHLGADAWELESVMDLCVSSSGSFIIDAEFPDGTSLGDSASTSTHGDMDGASLSFTLGDFDSDGDNERMVTR